MVYVPEDLLNTGRSKDKNSSSAGFACSPLGVLADLQSAVKKCPNLFMLWGFAIPSNQAVTSIRKTALCIIRRKGNIT